MVLNQYRDTADKILVPIAKRMSNINPDLISWLAFIFAVLSGVSYFFSTTFLVFLGGIFLIFNSLFDALDGKIAKLTDKASLRGDFLDHTIDRYADIFIIGGIVLGPLCRLWIGFFAVLGVLMTSYMGTQAHAVGVSRNYGGIAGRADRLALLILTTIVFVILSYFGITYFSIAGFELKTFEILMIWFAVTGHMTAIQRGIQTWRELD
ncbi:MAG: CDP-alcohol phosphatidyltransferase family protein [Thermoplasmatota archaeon]